MSHYHGLIRYPVFRIMERRMQLGQMSMRVVGEYDLPTEGEAWVEVKRLRQRDEDLGNYRDYTVVAINDEEDDNIHSGRYWYMPGEAQKRRTI